MSEDAYGGGLLAKRLVHFARQRALAHVENGFLAFPVRLEHGVVEEPALQHRLVHPDPLLRGRFHNGPLVPVRLSHGKAEKNGA